MRYSRALSPEFAALLSAEGPLARLFPAIDNAREGDPYALDIQFRGPGRIPVYHGWQALVWIEHRPEINAIVLNYNRNYRDQEDCIPLTHATRAIDLLSEYLPEAISRCRPAFYGDHAEGYWQNRLSLSLGRYVTPDHEWLVVDRIAAVDAGDNERRSFIDPIRWKYQEIRTRLHAEAPSVWGEPAPVGMRHECDLLGIGPAGELLCIEIKHGNDMRGFHWGLLEAAIAAEVFRHTPASFLDGIRTLIQQKVALGLLPSTIERRLPLAVAPRIKPVLVVVQAASDSLSWRRLGELRRLRELEDVELAAVTADGVVRRDSNSII